MNTNPKLNDGFTLEKGIQWKLHGMGIPAFG
jgi:hypothetical protein